VKLIAEWIVPAKTVSESNQREHWRISHMRHKTQKILTQRSFREIHASFSIPAIIVLTRLSPRLLDDDNLHGSLKHCRDALADCIIPGLQAGRADDPKYGLTFQVKQEKSKDKGIKIQIYEISNQT
jgi:hypothetical protein